MAGEWFMGAWSGPLRILVVGALAYLAVVVMLRISGNRTLATSSAFDHVVTVAFGSALATTFLSKQVTLVDGVAAFGALVLFQLVLALGVSRSQRLKRLLIHDPTVLLIDGRLNLDRLAKSRVLVSDVHAALRKAGVARVDQAALVVLESDGAFSVVPRIAGTVPDVTEGIRDQLTA